MSRLPWLGRLVLAGYPRALRDRFGDDLADVLADGLAAARRRGRVAVVRFWLRNLADVAVAAGPARPRQPAAPALVPPRPRGEPMTAVADDLRHAVRLFARRRGLAAAAVLSLALGVGANAAIVALVDATLFRELPVADPEALVGVVTRRDAGENTGFSYPDFKTLRGTTLGGTPGLAGLAAYAPRELHLGRGTAARAVAGQLADRRLFAVLGVAPALGTTFAATDDPAVAVLGHALWQSRFGGDPGVVGRAVTIGGRPFTVAGAMPRGFTGPIGAEPAALWLPLDAQPLLDGASYLDEPRVSWLFLLGRLAPGTTAEAARERLEGVALAAWAAQGKDFEKGIALRPAATGHPHALGDHRDHARLLRAAVALLLVLAAVNVAHLLLGLAHGRRRELGVRSALGASRRRLARQLAVEGLVLGTAAAVGAIVVARLALVYLGRFHLAGVDVAALDPRLDAAGLAATAALAVACGVAVAALPALGAVGRDLGGILAGAGRALAPREARLRRGLIVAEAAIAATLLVGAGLFARTLVHLRGVDVGFSARSGLLASADLGAAGVRPEAVPAAVDALAARVAALPGVTEVTTTTTRPVDPGGMRVTYRVPGYTPGPDEDMELDTHVVGRGYFQTLGMPLVAGHGLDDGPAAGEMSVVVNETFADRFLAGDAIGREVGLGDDGPRLRVVGVAADGRYRSLREAPRAVVYAPLDRLGPLLGRDRVTLVVRTAGDPWAALPALRAAVAEALPGVPLGDVRSLAEHLAGATVAERQATSVLAAFALLAVVVAAVGVGGVLAQSVVRRRREIAVRLALGANSRRVLRGVLAEGLGLAAAGLVLGLAAALAAGRLVEAHLYGVSPRDPATLGASALVLLAAAALAAYVPARRAARVDPAAVLRGD